MLSDAEAAAVEARVADVEASTALQVVCAVHEKSDTYPEIPWHAFALGASVSAAAGVVYDIVHPAWMTGTTLVLHISAMLLVGAVCALLTLWWPWWARLFLAAHRRDVEVLQHAKVLFLEHGLFATHARTGVLLYVSLFERKVEIVADRGFDGRMQADDWTAMIDAMTPILRAGRCDDALLRGLDALELVLRERGFVAAGPLANELPDGTLRGRGAS